MKRTSNSFYKYKSISNFEFILDILLYERLYAGKYHELNDPMEGVIKLDGTIPKEEITEWEQSLKNYNICCFTTDPENNLMWSHYADGGKGCLIEFELAEDISYSKVTYGKTPLVKAKEIRQLEAHEVFLHKLKYWQYEKEYRCILMGDNYLPIKIKSVKFGPKTERSKEIFLINILACCKPDLKIIRGGNHSVIKSDPFTISHKANKSHFTGEGECNECLRAEHARELFSLWKYV